MQELTLRLDCKCIMSSVVFDVYGWEMPEVPTASVVLPSTRQAEKFIQKVSPQYIQIRPDVSSNETCLEVRFSPSCQGLGKFRLDYYPEWVRSNALKVWSLQLYLVAGQYGIARVFHIDTADNEVILDSEPRHVDVVSNFTKIQQSYSPLH